MDKAREIGKTDFSGCNLCRAEQRASNQPCAEEAEIAAIHDGARCLIMLWTAPRAKL